LGDVLDVKASILLVVVVFLVDISKRLTESGPQLASHPMVHAPLHLLSIFLLATSVVLIFFELWPRKYALPPAIGEEDAWIEEKRLEAGQSDSTVVEELLKKRREGALRRVNENGKINSSKSCFLKWAFRAIIPVVLIDIAMLLISATQQVLTFK